MKLKLYQELYQEIKGRHENLGNFLIYCKYIINVLFLYLNVRNLLNQMLSVFIYFVMQIIYYNNLIKKFLKNININSYVKYLMKNFFLSINQNYAVSLLKKKKTLRMIIYKL